MPGQNTTNALKGQPVEVSSLGVAAGTDGSITAPAQTITLDLSTGTLFTINCTTTDAFTVAAPTNGYIGQTFEIAFKNTSGGTMGTPTFNAAFKSGTFTKPANGFQRSLYYRYDGTNFRQIDNAVDVAN